MTPAQAPVATPVQVFGLERDRATRAAIRFFKERRVPISFVDLRKRPIAPGELRRFVERLGAPALLDPTSRAYRDAGLGYLRMDDGGDRGSAAGRRRSCCGCRSSASATTVTVGPAEATWTAWLRPGGGS